ncbi:MAG: FAD-dependent oxidoreductase [Methylophaga sp.]|nr:FAD-dependent oxidoreductase [Methylophaga sp.]
MTMHRKPVVIIGSGLAGYTLVKEIRKLDASQPLLMITEDDGCFYSKPMLSNALSQQKSPDRLIQSSATEMAEKYQLNIISNSKVIELFPESHELLLDSGERIQYQQLVLATGASPRQLPPDSVHIDVADGDILSVNSLEHYRAFHQRLDSVEHVCVIGAGLIGCEFANDLLVAGKQVSLISNTPLPLHRVIPSAMSEALLEELKLLGMHWHCETSVQAIERDASIGLQIKLDRHQINADLVLLAIGLEVDLTLATQARIDVSDAILTDGYLQTSVADIYAIGDCAAVCGVNQKYVMPIMHAARSLASTLTGQPVRVNYPVMPVMVKTPAYPIAFTPLSNHNSPITEVVEASSTGAGLRALYHDADKRLTGFALSGDLTKERQTLLKQIDIV